MPLPHPSFRADALARTYDGHADPVRVVNQYRQFREASAEHPDAGYHRLATLVSEARDDEVPPRRVRGWLDGSKPDPYRAIETAEAHGWLRADSGDRVFEALVVLHAWVYAGGGISRQDYRPHFAVGEADPRDVLEGALATAGVEFRVQREDDDGRATELVPRDGGPVLGRYLHGVLGAPVGVKNEWSDVTLPGWLEDAPFDTATRWGRTYLSVRGTDTHPREAIGAQITEQRAAAYHEQVAEFLQALVADRKAVTRSGRNIYLSPYAADLLDEPPTLPDE